jgi:HAD superfamily hydrolase (TIGR01484 family)
VKDFDKIEPNRIRPLKYLLTDVDDTITSNGRLYPQALQALWDVKRAGLKIVLVTGGSAGWADVYIRQWPVDAVISESGAVAFYIDQRGERKTLFHPSAALEQNKQKKKLLIARVLSEVKGSCLSEDQFCRLHDIAFDHEDLPNADKKEMISGIVDICKEEGACWGVSSIHVNCWFGNYNKLKMVIWFMNQVYGLSEQELAESCLYCGDAANDIPLFQAMQLSVGVGAGTFSVWKTADCPGYVVEEFGGEGFARITKLLIEKKLY